MRAFVIAPGGARVTLMQVKALSHNPEEQQATVVLETQAGGLALGFLIPMNEANRLARVLGLSDCRCTPVYDLIRDLVMGLGASVSRTVLDAETEGICARLVFEREDLQLTLPCHPADAIALALLTGKPIYATAEALTRACPLTHPHAHEIEHSDLAQWLARVRPEDFTT